MLLIPRFGITGAAVATIVTLVLNFGFQAVLQRVAFRITGISTKIILVLVIGLLSFFAGWLIPRLPLIADIVIRSGLVTFVFTVLIYFSRVSPEANTLIYNFLRISNKR
jgi:O-antigen/teichoic acid export membrane protein